MKIAVVIPALDESSQISGAIASALLAAAEPIASRRAEARPGASGVAPEIGSDGLAKGSRASSRVLEVVVADGGSNDDTRALATSAGARVVAAPRGRARQLQAGVDALAEVGEGGPEVVLFLHADTRLPEGWAAAVEAALAQSGVVGGAFRFAFVHDADASLAERLELGFVQTIARLRVAIFGLPYGDQGLFARREVLDAIGGVPQVELMEDLDLVRALRGQGRLASLPLAATTSSRRHRERGVLRTACLHAWALGAWGLGMQRERIRERLRR